MTKNTQEMRKNLEKLLNDRKQLREDLEVFETQIYNFESDYLVETMEYGNLCTGLNPSVLLDAPLNKSVGFRLEKKGTIKDSHRLFSSTSSSSPLAKRLKSAQQTNSEVPPTFRAPLPVSSPNEGIFLRPSYYPYMNSQNGDNDPIPLKKRKEE